ncbi:SseB family protein [Pseudactinotalea sp. Z1739]|uniref:SseB family protein n=1 Tax=Pseudactinotalea sp. Z1739 TaxID=3413028 RepID=UPI003C7CAEDD
MARELPPTSAFAGDDGSTDPHLGAALALTGAEERLRAVVDALGRARLLVPVVAIAGEKQASAAMVTVATPDGRSAMPVFSALATLHAWRTDARPIPVPGPQVALATVTESDGLLVLDPAGPVPVLVPRPAVWALAQGRTWVPPADDEQLRDQVGAALRTVPGVAAVELEDAPDGATRVVLGVPAGLSRAQVDRITSRAGAELARCDLVAERVDSVQLRLRAC